MAHYLLQTLPKLTATDADERKKMGKGKQLLPPPSLAVSPPPPPLLTHSLTHTLFKLELIWKSTELHGFPDS